VPADAGDPDAALRRLESMGSSGTSPAEAGPSPLPQDPVVDPFLEPPPSRPPRAVSGAKRTPRVRPRSAGGSPSSRMAARIAAPVVFLVAVIALVGIVVNSGVMDEPAPTPTVKATKTKAGAAAVTKKYVVQDGDSLSSIAVRFKTTTAELKALNPDLSGSTVVIGERIVVPAQ
jgi:LysM repeat protein